MGSPDETQRFLEQLLAVAFFVDFTAGPVGIQLDRETKRWAQACKELTVPVLLACVNQHFGLIPADQAGLMEG